MTGASAKIALTLGELLGPSAGAHSSVRIRDLVIDSRDATPGAAFVAVRGARDHGLRHAANALAHGAEVVLFDPAETTETLHPTVLGGGVDQRSVAVPRLSARFGELADRLYGQAIEGVELAGITGTNGKTTVAYLVAQAMTHLGKRCGYIGTLGFGVPPELEPHALTTPDCFTLHRELAAIAAAAAEHAALEVSSHALAQHRIAGLRFTTAAFTNLSRDHLDAHGDLERYAEAKARLFALDGLRYAVLNTNDPFGARLTARLAARVSDGAHGAAPLAVALREPQISVAAESRESASGSQYESESEFGFGPPEPESESESASASEPEFGPEPEFECESEFESGSEFEFGSESASRAQSKSEFESAPLRARLRALGLDGLELSIEAEQGSETLRSPLVGAFNAENLLVALGVLLAWEVPLADACRALGRCTAPPGRLEVVRLAGRAGPRVVVDYAHTPDALARVLDTLRAHSVGELWCVFGCGGDRDRGKRALMGEMAAARADHIVVTDDNPRSEDPADIVREILAGIGVHPSVVVEHDRAAAIAHAVRASGLDDVVLVAGKGHEVTQRVGAVERPFSDRDVARAALEERA